MCPICHETRVCNNCINAELRCISYEQEELQPVKRKFIGSGEDVRLEDLEECLD
jgi:hypothetical protein